MSFLLSPQHIGRAGSSFELECSGGGQENFYSVGGVNYKSCTFLTTGTLTASNEGLVDVMVVSGGGGGNPSTSSPEGGFFGGGGGAGGMVVQTGLTISEGSGTVIVTAGSATGVNGQSSVIPSNIITSTASIGGGTSAQVGGSGGGANTGNHGGIGGSAGTPGQGNPGGSSSDRDSGSQGGGGAGGGAGQPGGPSGRTSSGAGGDGLQNAYRTGTGIWYGGGGGGSTGHYGIQTRGAGGQGGGGSSTSFHGELNTGGGGVGGTGAGGSGIVVIRYNMSQPG